ncbi:MAG: thioredoxin domain-containing protein [Sumerlaeia bacterium]
MAGELAAVTDETFAAEVFQSDKPVLVDFWGLACPSCFRLKPLVTELAGEYARQVRVLMADIEENRATAEDLGVMALPTLILFRGGVEAGRLRGIATKGELRAAMEEWLG